MTCGIYCITNNVNGMKYVGQSVCIEERFHQHIHSNSDSEIHTAIEEYGVSNFKFEILVACSPNELDEQEVKFIRLLGTYENGYNQTRGGQHRVFNVEYEHKQYVELENAHKRLKQKLSKKDKTISSLSKEMASLRLEISTLTAKNKSLVAKNYYLQKEMNQIEDKKIKPLRQRVANLEQGDWASFKNKIKLLKDENKELRFEIERIREKKSIPKSNIFYQALSEKREAEVKQ